MYFEDTSKLHTLNSHTPIQVSQILLHDLSPRPTLAVMAIYPPQKWLHDNTVMTIPPRLLSSSTMIPRAVVPRDTYCNSPGTVYILQALVFPSRKNAE